MIKQKTRHNILPRYKRLQSLSESYPCLWQKHVRRVCLHFVSQHLGRILAESVLNRQFVTNAIAAAPLTLWYGWPLVRGFPAISESFVYAVKHLDALYLTRIWAYASSTCFLLLFSIFMLVRSRPQKKSEGVLGRGAALLGAFGSSGFLLLPVSDQPIWFAVLSACLVSLGTTFTVYSLSYLGRSISLFPEVRSLVMNGPYRFIRHPVYLGEAVALVGTMLLYKQPWSVLLLSLIVTAQWVRILREEVLFDRTLPAFAKYRCSSYCLLPWIY